MPGGWHLIPADYGRAVHVYVGAMAFTLGIVRCGKDSVGRRMSG